MALSSNFEYVDYSASFTNIPARNRILTNLNIFQRDTTDQFKTSLDILSAMSDTIAPAAERFSNSQWGSVPKPKAANHLIELPLFPTQSVITAADVQPYRKFSSELRASTLDAVTAKSLAHYERFTATRERMYAEALFRHRVTDMQYTADGSEILDWSEEFGYDQSTGELSVNVTDDPLESLSDEVSKMKARLGGLAPLLKGIYLFAGSNVFKRIRFNPAIRELVKYHVLGAQGFVFDQDLNPGFSYYQVDNVTVVEMSDTAFYGVGPNEAYLVPVMDKPLGGDQSAAFTNLVGPTSRNLELAFADVVDFRIYSATDPLYKNITLSSEFSMLPTVFRPDLVTKLTMSA
ncbi:major capsid protein [Raoultella planticola]